MDQLNPLISKLALRAETFHAGELCHSTYKEKNNAGYLHILLEGTLHIEHSNGERTSYNEPSLIFFLQPTQHSLVPSPTGAKTVCSTIDFSIGSEHILANLLPKAVYMQLSTVPELSNTLQLLVNEVKRQGCGRQSMLDRLSEVLLIQIIRYVIEEKKVDSGLLAGLADKRLSKTLLSIHEQPENAWNLERMAETAGMSRARFADHFRKILNITPAEYLQTWRLSLAKQQLARGDTLYSVALDVGYSSASAFARAFSGKYGISPAKWQKQQLNL